MRAPQKLYQLHGWFSGRRSGKVTPEAELNDKALKYMRGLSDSGATKIFERTKRIFNAHLYQGLVEANRLNIELSLGIFETKDFRNGIRSILTEGPGKARFSDR